jgi:hypothetical protein
VNQIDYLTGRSEKSARDTFFYYTGATPSAVQFYDEAKRDGWVVISMKNDWKRIFGFESAP